jgi:hypothetical protein
MYVYRERISSFAAYLTRKLRGGGWTASRIVVILFALTFGTLYWIWQRIR